MATALVKDWTSSAISVNNSDALTKEGDTYASFDGISVSEDGLGENANTAYIGIYQVGDDKSVYALTSTTEAAKESGVKIKVGQGENEGGGTENNATLIASGTGSLSDDKTSVTGITMTLQGDDNAETFQKLGFSGENITKITDSDKADTIYVISGESKGLPEADLAFTQGGKDKVIFVGSSTIKSITSGGGYTRLRVRGHPRSEGF